MVEVGIGWCRFDNGVTGGVLFLVDLAEVIQVPKQLLVLMELIVLFNIRIRFSEVFLLQLLNLLCVSYKVIFDFKIVRTLVLNASWRCKKNKESIPNPYIHYLQLT